GAIAHCGLAPRGLGRHPGRGLAFASAVRMVAWIHDDTADLGPLPEMPGAAGLAKILVLVIEVADLADRGRAAHRDTPHLTGRKPDRCERSLFCEELGRHARGADDLAAFPRDELDVVD